MKNLTDNIHGGGSYEMASLTIGRVRTRSAGRARHKNNTSKKCNIVVSCQDIRNLATTLYLTSIPGLKEYEQDYDCLIDDFYNQSSKITD